MGIKTIIAVSLLLAAALPKGVDSLHWGMTAQEINKQVPTQKAELGHGYGYAEHAESDPDVYISQSDGQRHREFYFFRGKLYKIFTIYERNLTVPEFYQKLFNDLKKLHGAPARTYEDQIMGISVHHAEWSDDVTTIDLRMGAGFIYEVRVELSAAREKQVLRSLKQSI